MGWGASNQLWGVCTPLDLKVTDSQGNYVYGQNGFWTLPNARTNGQIQRVTIWRPGAVNVESVVVGDNNHLNLEEPHPQAFTLPSYIVGHTNVPCTIQGSGVAGVTSSDCSFILSAMPGTKWLTFSPIPGGWENPKTVAVTVVSGITSRLTVLFKQGNNWSSAPSTSPAISWQLVGTQIVWP